MSIFEEKLKNHRVHDLLESCFEALKKTRDKENITPDELEIVNRSEVVLHFVKDRINALDPLFVFTDNLDDITNLLSAFLNSIHRRGANPGEHNSYCGRLLNAASVLQTNLGLEENSNNRILSSFQDSSIRYLKEIKEQKKALEKEIAAAEAKLQSLNQLFGRKTKELDGVRDEQKRQNEQLRTEQIETADRVLCVLREKEEEARKYVGIIGNIGLTGNYQKIANEERKSANLFRWIAIGCFGAMLVAVIIVLVGTFKSETCDWTMALFRVLTAGIFAAPGVYSAMESAKHRRKEQENRRLELELASMSPFLEKLGNEEKATEILEKLAPQYFGNRATEDGNPMIGMDEKTLDACRKFIIDMAKAFRG